MEYGFRVKIVPDYATNKTIIWKSSNPNVATVSSTGRVKALKPGETTISATANNGVIAEKVVTVPEPIKIASIDIVNGVGSLVEGKTATLTVKILPSNAEDKTVTWSSSDSKVLTVDKNGKVKAVKKGTATVTVKAESGVSDSIKITVKSKEEEAAKDKVKYLQQLVKAYVKPTYKSIDYAATDAYKKAARSVSAGRGNVFDNWRGDSSKDMGGTSCCAYVITVMYKSGWDTSFLKNNPNHILSDYLRKSSKWMDVTSGIHSNKDAKPGDVIIVSKSGGQGHILLYSGKIDGVNGMMTSASLGTRVPMADSYKDISKYVNQGYRIYRLKQ